MKFMPTPPIQIKMVAKNSIFKKEFTKKIDIKQLQEFQTRFKSGKSHI